MSKIELSNILIEYPIHNSSSLSLQLHLFSAIGGKLDQSHSSIIVKALEIESLRIEKGERIGIIGSNGAGKTTLLRVLSGVFRPSRGIVNVEGTLSSFTNITLGMDPEASGLDNIIFRLVFMGLSFAEARALSPSIEAFSELGDYLRMPARTYSAGMYLRLAFAISTAIEPDIIVMDEMIGAGDASFREKAKKRIGSLIDKIKILVIATHEEQIMREFCNKIIWLDHGRIKMFGDYAEVFPAYEEMIRAI